MKPAILALSALIAVSGIVPQVAAAKRMPSHQFVAAKVASMVGNQGAQSLARRHKLNILNVMWEDTGRYQGSSVGPNISDVTIEVESEGPRGRKQTHLMPVVRYPNFTDKTGDIDIDKFNLRVGNQDKDGSLQTITLRQLLANPGRYMSLPNKGSIKGDTLLEKRDEKVLVSAQTALLPVRRSGKTKFWPVIFNYQSYAKNPAVLTILVTRQGTSMTIVDNSRDTVGGGASWGQRLYFNKGGERAPLLAERLSDVMAKGTTANGEEASSLGEDSNLLMLIQVPLKVKRQARLMAAPPMAESSPTKSSADGNGEMDKAVIGHGPTEGPYTELDGLTIERDGKFPVRVTVQFYQTTTRSTLRPAEVKNMARQISRVYDKADYIGSLVVPEQKIDRPTAWTGIGPAPHGVTVDDFPGLAERIGKYGVQGTRWYWRTLFSWYPE